MKHYNINNKAHLGFKHSKETLIKMSKSLNKIIGAVRIHKGYRVIKIGKLNWVTEHRYLVEKFIGYKLQRKWIIHHIDGNRQNNKMSNLFIFIKKGFHSSFESLVKSGFIKRNILKSNIKKFRR